MYRHASYLNFGPQLLQLIFCTLHLNTKYKIRLHLSVFFSWQDVIFPFVYLRAVDKAAKVAK